jgi:CRISPR-associated protein Csd1
MILQALHKLAQREGLDAFLDFEPKRISWIVCVGPGGSFVPPVRDARKDARPSERRAKGKPKMEGLFKLVPRQPERSGIKAPAYFLVDNAKYVFGRPVKEGAFSEEEGREKSSWFRGRVNACAQATGDPAAIAVAKFLDDVASGNVEVSLPDDCKPNDQFAFVYEPDVDVFVHHRPVVRRYWEESRRGGEQGEPSVQCLVTGEPVSDAPLFPFIDRVPGAPKPVSLVGFNNKAFESYGWSGNENAPVSRAAAEACATALNRLLDPAYPDPANPDQALPERHLRLSADTAVCYWAADESGDAFCDVLGGLLQANPERVAELYRSIWRGRHAGVRDETAFYALTLTGQRGRIIVRDWFESTVAEVGRNLAAYFADLDIVRNARGKDEAEDAPLRLALLLESLAPQGDRAQIPPPLIGQIVRAALQGTQFPFSLIERCVQRARAEIGLEGRRGLDGFSARRRADARAALLKAVLNRRKRFHPETTRYKEVQRSMDPLNVSEGYLLGNLMAVLECVQQAALGDVNASVVDRYFSGASATPKVVFVRLLKNTRHHVSKAKDGNQAGLVFRLEKLIDTLADRFDPKRNGFPAYLDLEQQGLFVLGYHQMRHWLWMAKEDRARWETEHRDAPAAYLWSKQS